jgi:hypothetical protein
VNTHRLLSGTILGTMLVGTFCWDAVSLQAADEPTDMRTVHADDTPLPPVTETERRRGFVCFTRDITRALFRTTTPDAQDRVDKLTLSACPGEYEPVVVAMRALRDLEDVRVTVSDLAGPEGGIPAASIDVRSVSFRPKAGQKRWGEFQETLMLDVPLSLEKQPKLAVPGGTNQPFWITVHVPASARPGSYRGVVQIHVDDRQAAELPLELTVHPFQLVEPRGVFFGLYQRLNRSPKWMAETFVDLRAHGVTGLAVCGSSGLPMTVDGKRVRIEWTGDSALEQTMDAYRVAGFTEPVLWLMSGVIPKTCAKVGPIESDAFAEAYKDVIRQIVSHGREAGWPEIIFQPMDEPWEHGDRLAQCRRYMALLDEIPGVRIEGDGMNGRWRKFSEEDFTVLDVMCLHDGPMLDRRAPVDMDAWWAFHARAKQTGKQLWFYNIDLTAWHPEPVRYMTGFGLWKAKADGVIEWAYMWPVKENEPGAVYEQPSALLYRFPAAPGESGGPTIGYEAMREGIDDYRYLLTLRARVDEAERSGSAAAKSLARARWAAVERVLAGANFDGCKGVAMQGAWTGDCEVLEDGRRIVRADHKVPNGWSFGDYARLRRMIAEAIVAIDKEAAKQRTGDNGAP